MSLDEATALLIVKEELRSEFLKSNSRKIEFGIGDDCAILQGNNGSFQVWTIDACNENSHFLWDWMSPEDIAYKSFHSALSDIPSMGAKPQGLLSHLTLSPRVNDEWLRRFCRAQAEIAELTCTPVVGGNLCFGNQVQLTMTVLGLVEGEALRRDGARPGDELWIMGDLGLARAGLLLLQRGAHERVELSAAEKRCLSAFRRPSAKLEEGLQLKLSASACMDVSDGLRKDVPTLATASRVKIVVDARSLSLILSADLSSVAVGLEESPLELALVGGEDYSLLAAGPSVNRPKNAMKIGSIEEGRGAFLRDFDGTVRSL